jgi:DNA-binding NarL/FixJ family response regulator
MNAADAIRIFIVDDHPMVIEGLRNMLQGAKGIEVAGYATNAAACRNYFLHQTAQVVLMDINLPDGNGVDLCAEIKKQHPEVKILGLSTMNHPSTVRSMKESGASGYLLKSSSDIEIIKSIETVNGGGEVWDSSVTLSEQKKHPGILLTRREKEILNLMIRGLSAPEISDLISMSLPTLELHQKSLLSKYSATSAAELVRLALENDHNSLTDLP